MIIFPAVDIQGGKAVRLKQGRAHEVTVFAENPVDAALSWQQKGAKWLHIVDLDGAFDGEAKNMGLVRAICAQAAIPVQLGGGIRTVETAKAYLEAGVTRLIIGTLALEDPKLFAGMCKAFPGKIGVSLDAESGILKSRGWLEDTRLVMDDVLPRLQEDGAAFIVYTDIERDGMQSGINIKALEHVASMATIPVIAAGGVASLDDVKNLYPLCKTSMLAGAISGKALYTGNLDLEEANAWIAEQNRQK